MPESVQHNVARNLIYIKSSGHIKIEDVKNSFKTISLITSKNSIKKILVNQVDALTIPGNVDAFNLGSEMAMNLKGIKVAIVISKAIKNDIQFVVKVVQARGGMISLFDKEKDAMKWLES